MKRILSPRVLSRSRRMLLLAAAIPLLQFGACGTAIGQTALYTEPQLPGIFVDAIGNAVVNTLFSLLGYNFGPFGATGGGTGIGGFTGS